MATIDITRNSELSGLVVTRTVRVNDTFKLLAFVADRSKFDLIQIEFPELSDEDREFILTGITPQEWDAAFPDE